MYTCLFLSNYTGRTQSCSFTALKTLWNSTQSHQSCTSAGIPNLIYCHEMPPSSMVDIWYNLLSKKNSGQSQCLVLLFVLVGTIKEIPMHRGNKYIWSHILEFVVICLTNPFNSPHLPVHHSSGPWGTVTFHPWHYYCVEDWFYKCCLSH